MNRPPSLTPTERMADFDALPPRARRALANADIAYDSTVIAIRIRRAKSLRRVVAAIEARTERRLRRQKGPAT